MRVLVVTNMYPTRARPWYGTFVEEQVSALRRAGASVDVLAFSGGRTRISYADAVRRLQGAVRRADYDVVHAHHGLAGAIGVTQRRVPVCTTFHGSDTGRIPWQLRISRLVAQHSTPIVVESTARDRLRAPHAHILPCGVDTTLCTPIAPEERLALGWDMGTPYALFPASPAKGVKNYPLFDSAICRYREMFGVVNSVRLEDLDRHEVARVVAAADVMVMTSISEGSPVAVKEALACNTPVVSVDVGDVRAVIGGLPGCAVTSRHPDDIARAVRASIEAGRSHALRSRALEYNNDAIAGRLLEIYREMVGTRPRRLADAAPAEGLVT